MNKKIFIKRDIKAIEDASKQLARHRSIDPDLATSIQEHLRYALVIAAGSLIEQTFYDLIPLSISRSGKLGCVHSIVKKSIAMNMYRYFDYKCSNESKAANCLYASLGIVNEIDDIKKRDSAFCESEIAIVQLMKTRNETAHEYKIESFKSYTIQDIFDKYKKSRIYLSRVARVVRSKV